jgi:RecA/RadA recombinase
MKLKSKGNPNKKFHSLANKSSNKKSEPDNNMSERRKQLRDITNSMNKDFGVNAVRLGCDLTEEERVIQRIRTGNVSLDIALGGGKRLPSIIVM